MQSRRPIPTLGYPSQHAAIVAFYEEGIAPSVIARRIGAPINAVTRSIHKHQQKTGVVVPVAAPVRRGTAGDPRFKLSVGKDWRMRNYLRSVRGARAALEAAGL